MKTCRIFLLSAFPFLIACKLQNSNPSVSTFAGNGIMGFADGNSQNASFANMMGIAVDTNGNVYVADSHNNAIRKITPDGLVSTIAGSGLTGSDDGKGNKASFFNPAGITLDRNGNLFIADTHNNLIRKITLGGLVSTIAGRRSGNNDSIKFDNPQAIAVDFKDNIYVADWANDVIRKITPDGRIIILAGHIGSPGSKDGKTDSASFYLPGGIAVDVDSTVYISDTYNNMIRKITANGYVSTLAGKKTKGFADGKGTNAAFLHPQGIAIDKFHNIYVADAGNNRIRKITPDGMVTTVAGNGMRGSANGPLSSASFYRPFAVAVDKNGSVYVADYQNNLIRKISF